MSSPNSSGPVPQVHRDIALQRIDGAIKALSKLSDTGDFVAAAKAQETRMRPKARTAVEVALGCNDEAPAAEGDKAQRRTGKMDALLRVQISRFKPSVVGGWYRDLRRDVEQARETSVMHPVYNPEAERTQFDRGYKLTDENRLDLVPVGRSADTHHALPPWMMLPWRLGATPNADQRRAIDTLTGELPTDIAQIPRDLHADYAHRHLAAAIDDVQHGGFESAVRSATLAISLAPDRIVLNQSRLILAVALAAIYVDEPASEAGHQSRPAAIVHLHAVLEDLPPNAMDARSVTMRAAAHLSLGNLGDGNPRDHFRHVLDVATEKEQRAAAHLGLGLAGDGNRRTHFNKTLELTAHPGVRHYAKMALEQLGRQADRHSPQAITGFNRPSIQSIVERDMLVVNARLTNLRRATQRALRPARQAASAIVSQLFTRATR